MAGHRTWAGTQERGPYLSRPRQRTGEDDVDSAVHALPALGAYPILGEAARQPPFDELPSCDRTVLELDQLADRCRDRAVTSSHAAIVVNPGGWAHLIGAGLWTAGRFLPVIMSTLPPSTHAKST
jgi:hypothetical protein